MKGKQIYWEDVEVGQEIPGFSVKIGWTQVVKQVSGTQDFVQVHHDLDFAKSWGHPAPFMNTMYLSGLLARVVTDWMGDEGMLRKFNMQMRKMNYLGDTMTLKGKVVNKYLQDNEHYVEVDVWNENNREGGVTTPGKCFLTLPSRARSTSQ